MADVQLLGERQLVRGSRDELVDLERHYIWTGCRRHFAAHDRGVLAPVSTSGIAREYAALLAEAKPEQLPRQSVRKRALELATKNAAMVELTAQTVEQEQIVEEV